MSIYGGNLKEMCNQFLKLVQMGFLNKAFNELLCNEELKTNGSLKNSPL